jgi:adenylate cyclase
MAEQRTTRKLAAILAADVVGYSRMMGADEAGTLAALKRHRETVFDPAVAEHNGRIVKLIGDGALVEFGSVVDAVNCALSVQQKAAKRETTAEPNITLRIGINLGDVIIEGDDIYGDGVNIAARLEPLAAPGGVCIASIVNESVGSRVNITFQDGGEVNVKNIDRPIRVWKWHPDHDPLSASTSSANLAARDKGRERPSIAVLPLNNMSGDTEQEYFADGITEDIITDLSKVAGLTVIARNSSFVYKDKRVDVRTVARELGVTSVLEGSIRRAGDRVRITAQLIDATTGAHLWAERYDRNLTDIFEVQDEVTMRIVEALKVTLTPSEEARIIGGPTGSVQAHDLFLKGRELIRASDVNRDKHAHAVALLEQAIALDRNFAQAHAVLAWAHLFDYNNRWSANPDASLQRADELACRAVMLDPDEPDGQVAAALTAQYLHGSDRAKAAVDRALATNPNYALALNVRGAQEVFAGEPERGIPDIERAMRLDPGFSQQYLHYLGMAHFMMGNYETAATIFGERILLAPQTDVSRAMLAATFGHLGRAEDAKRVWVELKKVNPKFSASEHFARLPLRRSDVAKINDGLAKAGLTD